MAERLDDMKCGNCKHCAENNICNGDCLCKAQDIEVSEDDDIHFYGELGCPCGTYEEK